MKTLQKYRVKIAYEGWSVGAIIEPVGLWRDNLLARGLIEPVTEQPKALEKHVQRNRKRLVDEAPRQQGTQEPAVG